VDRHVGLSTHATGVNNHDEIVGNVDEGPIRRAFRIAYGSPITPLMDAPSTAAAISDSGLVAGHQARGGHPGIPTLWHGFDEFTALWPDTAEATDVNSAGQVVGRDIPENQMRIWQWSKDGIRSDCIPHPLTATCTAKLDAKPTGINNHGQVVGWASTITHEIDLGPHFAFFWNGSGNSESLGFLPTGTESEADDINDEGFVVGTANRFEKDLDLWVEQAFIFHKDFGMVALPRPKVALPWGRCRAMVLNERNRSTGVILVAGHCLAAGGDRAVRWEVIVPSRYLLFPDPLPLPFPFPDLRPAP
jgi:probable HAF family extracellular repeat protein